MRHWYDTTVDEIYAFIGILLHGGATKSGNVNIKELFQKSISPFYRAVMPLYRFELLTRFLRFDDSRTRADRLKSDKLAPIRHIWSCFQNHMTLFYRPSKELCIDEQLVTMRNRCSFRQYIPSKPGKYGIKIFWLVDAKTNYPLSGEIYLGAQSQNERAKNIAYDLVKRLSCEYMNKGYNITMDNFFTSCKLADDFITKDTTIIGTIRSNKPELPKLFTSSAEAVKRGVFASAFCYSGSKQLCTYTTRSQKNVLLLSTPHAADDVDPKTRKPLVIMDYNNFKGGVDTFDKMLRCYTCKRKSNRWPMIVFFNILDVAALAAYRAYTITHPNWNPNTAERRAKFIRDLSLELAHNHLLRRSKQKLNRETRNALDDMGYEMPESAKCPLPTIVPKATKKPCITCSKERKETRTTAVCDLCTKPYCVKHYIRLCESCYQNNIETPENSDEEEEDEMPSTSRGTNRTARKRPPSPI